MLVRLSKHTLADAAALRLALMTNAHDAETRRLWVCSNAAPEEPIEVARPYQAEVLKALKITGLEGADLDEG